MRLCVFDFDSTLMDGETIDFFAEALGIKEKVAVITERAMNGEIDFFESLQERVRLLKGLEVDTVETISRSLPYMPGAKETIAALKADGLTVVCFSGGFRSATTHARDVLGFDADFSNALHARDGRLTGEVGGDMMFNWSKGDMLERLQRIMNVTPEETMVVGDGANDLSMFKYAGTRVAFCAKAVLKKEANIIIDTKDLREILGRLV